MGNFNRDNRSGGSRGGRDSGRRDSRRQDFGGSSRGFSGRSSQRPEMHKAICDECGRECEVPFRPTGDRPIFCSSCFENRGGNENAGKSSGQKYGRSNFGDKRMHEAVCDKCGNKCEVPFRPTGDKPVYCNQCFGKGNDSGSRGAGQKTPDKFKEQLEMLNVKLDKILKVLVPASTVETVKKSVSVKKTEIKKTDDSAKVKPKVKAAKAKTVAKKVTKKKKK